VLDHIDEFNDVWMSKMAKRKDFITESLEIKSRPAKLDNLYSEDPGIGSYQVLIAPEPCERGRWS
jgi:hypothetical protein